MSNFAQKIFAADTRRFSLLFLFICYNYNNTTRYESYKRKCYRQYHTYKKTILKKKFSNYILSTNKQKFLQNYRGKSYKTIISTYINACMYTKKKEGM